MNLRSPRGFTLLEVLMSTAVLAVAIGMAMSSSTLVSSSEQKVKRFAKAHNIGVGLMEELLATFPTDDSLTAGDHSKTYDMDGAVSAAAPVFTARWKVTMNSPVAKTMTIEVYVEWQDDGHTRTVYLQTYRST